MSTPTVESSNAVASPMGQYSIDDTPLTQEEENFIAKMEESHPAPAKPSPSVSPSRKKRKRANSASPHLTPSRLRSSVKVTARAMDAGYKPNNNHSFRQELPSEATGPVLSTGQTIADGESRTLPSESTNSESTTQQVAELNGGFNYPGNHSRAPADDARRSESIGPSVLQPTIQPGFYGYTRGNSDHPGPYQHYVQVPPSADDARRSLSIGPPVPQPIMQPGPYGYTGGIGDRAGAYHPYPQMPPSAIPQQYGPYPGMQGPSQYFQSAGPAYANMQSLQFYQQPPFRDQKMTRPQTEMPTEGPNPSDNIHQ